MTDSRGRASFRRSLGDALATADLRRLQLAWTAVTARTDGLLYALDRESFLAAVAGHRSASRTAHSMVEERSEQDPVS